MLMCSGRRRSDSSLIGRYANQLGSLVERRHSEAALLAAKQEAERAAASLRGEMAQRVRAMADLEYLAKHDPLTDLPNRALFGERLDEGIRAVRQRGTPLALMFLDLDHFKDVNDTLGHDAGDALLCLVARRLKGCVRSGDTVARLGGDEFAVIQTDLAGPEDARAQAERILAVLAEPFDLNGNRMFTSGSVGITLCPADGASPAELQKNADLAMYQAKLERSSFQFFDSTLNVEVARRAFLEQEMRQAIERGQFELHYQPRVLIAGGATAGAEALLRWRHPKQGMVPPDEFIPVAERSGLIADIGDWVLHQACRQFRRWHLAGHRLSVAVNLSAAQFKHRDVPALVRDVLAETGMEPSLLELEITETAVMRDMRDAIDVLRALRALGVGIAIDDFGTGYSSLNYLRQLPVDRIKIDKSFISDLANGGDAAAITRAIVGLGRSLDLGIVAEGVETPEQLDYLRNIGCTEGQGWLFSRAVPAQEFEQFLGPAG